MLLPPDRGRAFPKTVFGCLNLGLAIVVDGCEAKGLAKCATAHKRLRQSRSEPQGMERQLLSLRRQAQLHGSDFGILWVCLGESPFGSGYATQSSEVCHAQRRT
jgi:hypothetical protein